MHLVAGSGSIIRKRPGVVHHPPMGAVKCKCNSASLLMSHPGDHDWLRTTASEILARLPSESVIIAQRTDPYSG